jgi:Fe-S cluster assembly protein SufD
MNHPEARISTLEQASRDWLSAPDVRSEPKWLLQRRQVAREYFLSRGLPSAKNESFRFLPLNTLASKNLMRAPVAADELSFSVNLSNYSASVGFLDGLPVGGGTALPQGLRVERLTNLLATEADALEPYLGRLATPINGFAALGLALFDDAWVIRVSEGVQVELPLEVVVRQQESGYWVIPRLLVILEPRSRLALLERQAAADTAGFGLSTGIFELYIAEGAALTHVRLATHGHEEAELSTAAVEVHAGGHYHSWVGSLGGALTRLDTQVRLMGTGARVDLDGLYVARNRELVDHHTVVVHESENTTAVETYRGIVDDEAQAVFDGLMVVKPGAQRTNAQQTNRNLVLSDTAIVHTKPQLEIEADDVVCNHGATVGRLDAEQLFYLKSRGLSAAVARQVLTTAFAGELIERCPIAPIIPNIKRRATTQLGCSEDAAW